MNSPISVYIFKTQGVVLLVGKETDDSATAERDRSLAQSHRQTADLLAFATQKNIPNQYDLNLCGRLPVLLKLQRIVLNRQCPGAVIPRVPESQQMSRPGAESSPCVPSLRYFLAWRSQAAAKQNSRRPK